MRSLAITALAASSAISAHAASLPRGNTVIVNFDMFDELTCDFSAGQPKLGSHLVDESNLGSFSSEARKCRFFGDGTAPVSIAAVVATEVGDACELFVYVDDACSTPPADPRTGGCVFNGKRFRSWALECTGEFL